MCVGVTRNIAFYIDDNSIKDNDVMLIFKLFWIMDGWELKEEGCSLTYSSNVIVNKDDNDLCILTMFTTYQPTTRKFKSIMFWSSNITVKLLKQ